MYASVHAWPRNSSWEHDCVESQKKPVSQSAVGGAELIGEQLKLHPLILPSHVLRPQPSLWLADPNGRMLQVPVEQSPQLPQLVVAQQYPLAEQ